MSETDNKPKAKMVPEPVEANGTIIRNTVRRHKYELGAVVELDVEIYQLSDGAEVSLKGTCQLIVVGHDRDCDMTPLYILSDLPVIYPADEKVFSQPKLVYKYLATLVESGYGEESLRPTGRQVPLKDTVAQWLGTED